MIDPPNAEPQGRNQPRFEIAIPIFLVIIGGFTALWDGLRTSCGDGATLFIVRRDYVTGLWGHSYGAWLGSGERVADFDRVNHWGLKAAAYQTGVELGLPSEMEIARTNLLDPLHAQWAMSASSGQAGSIPIEMGSIQREIVGFYEPYTTRIGRSVIRSTKGWLWGRGFDLEIDSKSGSVGHVADAERFLYSKLPFAPVHYRMCVAKGVPAEATFGLLASVVVADIQNDGDNHKK